MRDLFIEVLTIKGFDGNFHSNNNIQTDEVEIKPFHAPTESGDDENPAEKQIGKWTTRARLR